jgi:hypothetical protein
MVLISLFLAAGVALGVFEAVTHSGGLHQASIPAGQSTTSSSRTSESTAPTTTTLAVTKTTIAPLVIPPKFSQFRGLVRRIEAYGVSVAELRPLPSSERKYTGVKVVLPPQSDAQMAIATHLVERAAILEKKAGTQIDEVLVAHLTSSGQVMDSTGHYVNDTIDPSWYAPAGMTLEEAAQEIRTYLYAALGSSPFHLVQLSVTPDPDGTRVVRVEFSVASAAVANEYVANHSLPSAAGLIDYLNAHHDAKLGLVLTEISTAAEEPIYGNAVDWELPGDTGGWAPSLTNMTVPYSHP